MIERKTRGADKKKRKSREYEETVRMQLKLKPYLSHWVHTKSGGRPSKFVSFLISQAMNEEILF